MRSSDMGVLVYPADPATDQVLEDGTFEVHLMPHSDTTRELVYPASVPFEPPPGKYSCWVEGESSISLYPVVMGYSGGEGFGTGPRAKIRVYPAGLVRLSPDISPRPGVALRLIHVDSHNRLSTPQHEFIRHVAGDRLIDGVRMPTGPVLGLLYDLSKKEYLAISNQVQVEHATTAEVAPAPPTASTDLMAILSRPRFAESFEGYSVEPVVVSEDGVPLKPDVVIRAVSRLYGIWRGLSGRSCRLDVESPAVFLEPGEIQLRPGKLEVVRLALTPKPNINVHLDLPEPLRSADMTIRVLQRPDLEATREVKVHPDATSQLLEALPPEEVVVSLEITPWLFQETVDLSDGQDASVRFAPEPIHVTGTVFRGDEGHPAVVHFVIDGSEQREASAEADYDGFYETILWRAGTYVTAVELAEREGPPQFDFAQIPDQANVTVDFHLSASEHLIRVLDVESGEGIAEATVVAGNKGTDDVTSSQQVVTDEDGIATLQPLKPGTLILRASADGYFPSQPKIQEVMDDDGLHEIDIHLRPVGDTTVLMVMLPGGTPAAGAELRAQVSLGDEQALWQGRTDNTGVVEVPNHLAGVYLLTRHPEAAFSVQLWEVPDGDPDEIQELRLGVPSQPLSVATTDSFGNPAPWVRLRATIGGLSLSGLTLAWLTYTDVGITNVNGYWRGGNLPQRPLELLGWLPTSKDLAMRGDLDATALAVQHPWPTPVELTVAK